MIDKARALAAEAGVLDRITFVKGALEDLRGFKDRSFDLVMSFDAPISYTYPNQERVISELVRIGRKRLMLSVSSSLGSLPYAANPIQKNQFILDESSGDGRRDGRRGRNCRIRKGWCALVHHLCLPAR